MVMKVVAGVAGLRKAVARNGLAESATPGHPAKTAGNPIDCRTSSLREKLRLIRDSDHPASPWARNVVQCLDEMKNNPDDAPLLRALGQNVAMFERMMAGSVYRVERFKYTLTPEEIAALFGLGEQPSDLQ